MDFNVLPKDKYGFDNALVMICRLSKTSWTIPCQKGETARDAAKMYYEGPYRIFGLPQEVITDRGSVFLADFTDELSKILGVKWRPSSAGYHQTAGQVENLNEWINQRLRPYVSHFQDNWSRAIPSLDFAQGGVPHDSTGVQPHEVTMGFPMPQTFDWTQRTTGEELADLPLAERVNREQAQEVAERIQGYVEFARETLFKAQARQAEQANRQRREPDFGVGDRVFIIKRTTLTDRPSSKLDYPMTRGHYEILESLGNDSFRLRVPENWQGCDVYHADRLRKYPNNPLPGQAAENPEGELLGESLEYEVEKVLTSQSHYKKLQYRVAWKGWDLEDDKWYYADDFKNAATLLKAYHDEYPEKDGPPIRL